MFALFYGIMRGKLSDGEEKAVFAPGWMRERACAIYLARVRRVEYFFFKFVGFYFVVEVGCLGRFRDVILFFIFF